MDKIKVQFEIELLRIVNVSAKLNGRMMFAKWMRGSKTGTTGRAIIESEVAAWPRSAGLITLICSLYRDHKGAFETKKVQISLKAENSKKSVESAGKLALNLIPLAVEGFDQEMTMPLGKQRDSPVLFVYFLSFLFFS